MNQGALLEIGIRLTKVENLLDQAVKDLTDGVPATQGAICSAALAQAAGELQEVQAVASADPALQLRGVRTLERVAMQRQLGVFQSRMRSLERLLRATAEFYCGWCAAGYAAAGGQPSGSAASGGEFSLPGESGYAPAHWSAPPGPALLAVSG